MAKGTAVKPVGAAYGGSNPPLSTIFPLRAGIAQWPERQPSKLRVAGSSPVSRSSIRARVAQSVERILVRMRFTGSIPVAGSMLFPGTG